MNKNLRWRVLAILVALGLGIWAIYPPHERIRLGLDLRGGVHLVLRVQTDDALRVETETSAERMRAAMERAGAPGATAHVVSPTTFEVRDVPPTRTPRCGRWRPRWRPPTTASRASAAPTVS
jgi:preprotein translocase subunit SecD